MQSKYKFVYMILIGPYCQPRNNSIFEWIFAHLCAYVCMCIDLGDFQQEYGFRFRARMYVCVEILGNFFALLSRLMSFIIFDLVYKTVNFFSRENENNNLWCVCVH